MFLCQTNVSLSWRCGQDCSWLGALCPPTQVSPTTLPTGPVTETGPGKGKQCAVLPSQGYACSRGLETESLTLDCAFWCVSVPTEDARPPCSGRLTAWPCWICWTYMKGDQLLSRFYHSLKPVGKVAGVIVCIQAGKYVGSTVCYVFLESKSGSE